jgi:hypothetical protein
MFGGCNCSDTKLILTVSNMAVFTAQMMGYRMTEIMNREYLEGNRHSQV